MQKIAYASEHLQSFLFGDEFYISEYIVKLDYSRLFAH